MEKLLKNTALTGFLTFCSRALGLVRDACIAMIFGTTAFTDAFFIALRPFDLVRKMFSDGVFGTTFIPVFSKEHELKGPAWACRLFLSLLIYLSLAGVFMVVLGVLAGPAILAVIAPGYASGSYEHELTLLLFYIMLPYVWFIMLTALCMGVLNYFDDFLTPAYAPLLFNLTVITFTICLTSFSRTPIYLVAIGVTMGGLIQLMTQVPALKKRGLFGQMAIRGMGKQTWNVLKRMLPAMVGAASYQINIMAASFFASTLDKGSVSYLYFADRLVQFPLGLFVVSAAIVFLPDLSKKAASDNFAEIGEVFSNGIRLVLFITIPAMAGLAALNQSIVSLLFERGLFDAAAVHHTADCLFILVSGLWAFACVRLFVTLHFAVHNVKIPFFSGVISLVVNLVLCVLLIGPMGLKGLAAAVSIGSMAGFVYLCTTLPAQVQLDKNKILVSACRSVFLSGIMFILVKTVSSRIGVLPGLIAGPAISTLLSIGIGTGFYLGASFWLSSPELKQFLDGIKKRTS